jgi:hypothetical protein
VFKVFKVFKGATIGWKGVDIAMKPFASEGFEGDELSVFLVGKAHRLKSRPSRSMRPLWEASSGWHRVDHGPSWRLPQLWDPPAGGEEEGFSTARVMPLGLPAYKRTWRQLALF